MGHLQICYHGNEYANVKENNEQIKEKINCIFVNEITTEYRICLPHLQQNVTIKMNVQIC